MTAAIPDREGLSIGAVLSRLRPDFPDVTISKIRFLESEGLVTPARTESGYRQFTEADVQRLRYVLAAQRDQYLPLKVIKEQLDAADRGTRAARSRPLVAVEGLPTAQDFAVRDETPVSRADLWLLIAANPCFGLDFSASADRDSTPSSRRAW